MIYQNSFAKLLPLEAMRALGIEGARADAPSKEWTPAYLQTFTKHYGPGRVLLCLPHYLQSDDAAVEVVRRIISSKAKIDKIEIANEPEGTLGGSKPMTPVALAARSRRLRKATAGTGIKLYGPSPGIWLPGFIDAFLAAGGDVDVITWHEYTSTIEEMRQHYLDAMCRWGKPCMVTETAFSPLPEWKEFKIRGGQIANFPVAAKAFGKLDWCLYSGPVPANDPRPDVGFCDWDGGKYVTNANYDKMLAAVRAVNNDSV